MVKFLLERIAPVHIDTESIRYCVCGCVCVYFCVIFDSIVQCLTFFLCLSSVSALIKQVNKSIDGTADDEEEGVPTEEAIRAGLELLKVKRKKKIKRQLDVFIYLQHLLMNPRLSFHYLMLVVHLTKTTGSELLQQSCCWGVCVNYCLLLQ